MPWYKTGGSLMAQWLRQASQGHEMNAEDMGLILDQVELGMHITSRSHLNQTYQRVKQIFFTAK